MLTLRELWQLPRNPYPMKKVCCSLSVAWCLVMVASVQMHAQDPVPPVSSPSPSPTSTIVERVLVRVNGEIFTQSQLTSRQIDALRDVERDPARSLEQQIAAITPDLLVTVVDELLLVQQGRELGFSFSDEQFQSALENVKKSNNLDDEGLMAVMAEQGLTMEQLRQQFEQQYLIQGVQQREIGPSMTITVEEQRQYYKRNAEQFMTPLTVTLRELLVTVPTRTENNKEVFSVADDESAKKTIEDLRQKALAGADFAELAKTHSESGTQSTGGLVGPVNVDDLSPALKELVAGLEPGGTSEPVRVARGYQIFKLEARSVPELRPFDEVRRQIESAIRNERIGPETDRMLTRLRAQAVIEWKDENLKQLYENRIAELAQS